jgi:hypothetical protein
MAGGGSACTPVWTISEMAGGGPVRRSGQSRGCGGHPEQLAVGPVPRRARHGVAVALSLHSGICQIFPHVSVCSYTTRSPPGDTAGKRR